MKCLTIVGFEFEFCILDLVNAELNCGVDVIIELV